MACNVTLRDLLENEASGGSWRYNGFDASYDGNKDNLVQFGSGGGGGTYSFPSPGGTVTGGDNPTINFAGANAGTYSFSYIKGTDTKNTVVHVTEEPCAGTTTDYWACEDTAGSVNVADILELGGCTPLTTGGEWTYSTGLFNPTTQILSPFVTGDYNITYTVKPSETFGELGCTDCIKTATLRVHILPETTFKESTYWVDIRPQMDQLSLDDFKITSFIYNGTQYVTSPVGFGTKSVIAHGAAGQYLANVATTLNGIGIPAMSFAYSDQRECNPYNGSGLGSPVTLATGGVLTINSIRVIDTNGDGRPDIQFSLAEDAVNIRRIINNGGGSFGTATSVPGTIPGGVTQVDVDMDNDGLLDRVSISGNNVVWQKRTVSAGNTGYKYVKIKHRVSDQFEIIIKRGSTNIQRITQNSNEYWDGTAWVNAAVYWRGLGLYLCGNDTIMNPTTSVGCA